MTVPSGSSPACSSPEPRSCSPPTRSTELLMGAMETGEQEEEEEEEEEGLSGQEQVLEILDHGPGGIWLGSRNRSRTSTTSQMSGVATRGPASGGGTTMAAENESGGGGGGKHRNNRSTTVTTSNNQTNQQGGGGGGGGGADSPPASPAGSDRGARACCFCWCCCCSCSWEHVRDLNSLTVKNSEDSKNSKDTRLDPLNGKEEQPTLEEIRSWSDTFDKLMSSSGGRKIFREFLRSEYSEENMLFWLACEELKTEQNAEAVEEKARVIYEDYISILSPREVSLDSRVREVINRNMVDPTPRTFDEAQLQIYTLMNRDSYPRFVNSQLYKRLLQQAS